jgi:LPPG:FO 2-phospho-L-lactate transferase
VDTDEGQLGFQDYFVRRRCEPAFRSIRFEGAEAARPAPALLAALTAPDLEAVVICPSNPVLSIGPILAIPGVSAALRTASAPRIAISPFIGGEAVKGPAAKIFRELGVVPGAAAVAGFYAGLVDAIMCDFSDPDAGKTVAGVEIVGGDTLMRDDAGQQRLADDCRKLAAELRAR